MSRLPLLVTCVLALAGCSSSTPLSVENHSGLLLEDVVVSGSGFRQALGDIAPGTNAEAEVSPRGESGLAIAFVASGKVVSLPPDGYFEGGGHYAVNVVVTPKLEAFVESRLRP